MKIVSLRSDIFKSLVLVERVFVNRGIVNPMSHSIAYYHIENKMYWGIHRTTIRLHNGILFNGMKGAT